VTAKPTDDVIGIVHATSKAICWIVPLDPGALPGAGPVLVVEVDGALRVSIRIPPDVATISTLAACQLGQALLDASAYAGQRRARRAR
jgi:hypothetical protein